MKLTPNVIDAFGVNFIALGATSWSRHNLSIHIILGWTEY